MHLEAPKEIERWRLLLWLANCYFASRPGYSFERPGRRVFMWITVRLESSPFVGVCPNWDNASLISVAQSVAQLAEGFALSRDADSTAYVR
jgi:hypothetical protein